MSVSVEEDPRKRERLRRIGARLAQLIQGKGVSAEDRPRKRDWPRLIGAGGAQLILIVGVPALAIFAFFASDAVSKAPPPGKMVILTLAQDRIRVSPALYCRNDEVTLIVVYPSDVEKGTFATARTSGTLKTGFLTTPPSDVRVQVERGEGDASIAPVLSALASANDIYLIADERCGSGG